jgi:AraC-like DNA-binding protein
MVDAVRFVCCFPLDLPPAWRPSAHRHDGYHEFILVEQGSLRSMHLGRRVEAETAAVLFDPEGLRHEHLGAAKKPSRILVTRWQGHFQSLPRRGPCVVYDREQRLRTLFRWMLDLHPSERQDDCQTLDALTLSSCHEFHRLLNPEPLAFVDRVRVFMREHLQQRVALDDLAAVAEMSRFHFARRFKQATGHSPMDMLIQLRMERAQYLLLHQSLTLDAIANQVGLVDASHLSRHFRRHLGLSPGAFRKRALGR